MTEIIYHQVKAGKPVSKREFTAVIDALREKGCDAVVLGCTELPLMLRPGDLSVPALDTAQIHIAAIVREMLK